MVQHSTGRQPLRWCLAAAVFLAFAYGSLLTATLAGWSLVPAGADRLREGLDSLVISAVLGIAAVGGARRIVNRPFQSPWLLIALLIPAYMALELAGVIR
ncbi:MULTISPECIES: hypothetical protein [unclassified Streptomyces]|uniref:hypothetical protein n=1 Tax=unclassified Streptomyces TaxID=2593676 RepID=UPI001BE5708A|nr:MULTISPECIES: hypothetical protein [unclassified Streptomyces]MBT2404927.1 hypothetical protein [Streptomyces sp. ISL-21]MBT2455955.1 hypothetical protein [Streptomyces sp. ISL-86]MBT2611344.1 hypothetical protein [Streptomyces sp. ISL-87]